MTTLFSTSPGRVSVLPEDTPSGIVMAIGGNASALAVPGRGSFLNMRAIITDAVIDDSDKYQLRTTFGQSIFAYVFGSGIGDFRVSGLAFTDTCIGGGSGLERIMNYFNSTRISNSGQAYDMVLGVSAASRYKVLLHGMRLGLSNPEARMVEFGLSYKAFR